MGGDSARSKQPIVLMKAVASSELKLHPSPVAAAKQLHSDSIVVVATTVWSLEVDTGIEDHLNGIVTFTEYGLFRSVWLTEKLSESRCCRGGSHGPAAVIVSSRSRRTM